MITFDRFIIESGYREGTLGGRIAAQTSTFVADHFPELQPM
jgi:hypothetical protein